MALNENIKSRRIQLKMSQEYVADQLGISRQAVAKWESGQSRPTSSNLTELAALFEMNVSELVDPQKWAEDKKKTETLKKDSQRNAKNARWQSLFLPHNQCRMGRLFFRFIFAYASILAGNFSSRTYTALPDVHKHE